MADYLSKNPIPTSNIKSPISIGNIKSPIFIGNIKNPVPTGNILIPILIVTILSKSPRLLTLGKEKISWYNCCLNVTMAKKPWQSSYESLLGVILKIMISCYKPMKCMITICVATSTLMVNIQTHKLNV